MKYTGPLYGKIGRRTIPLKMTSTDVDRLQEERNELLEALQTMLKYDAASSRVMARAAIAKAKGTLL